MENRDGIDSLRMSTQQTWTESSVVDEWLPVAVVSLTVNACFLVRGVVSRLVVRRWRRRRKCGWTTLKDRDCEIAEGGTSRSTSNKLHDGILVAAYVVLSSDSFTFF